MPFLLPFAAGGVVAIWTKKKWDAAFAGDTPSPFSAGGVVVWGLAGYAAYHLAKKVL